MAHQEACQLFIEQEIEKGLAEGKKPYRIGKDLSAWVGKLFETSIPPETIRSRARFIKKRGGEITTPPPTPTNSPEIQDNQVAEVKHGGKREGAGPPLKYEKVPEPPKPYSCAKQMADLAIDHLGRIPEDDPKQKDGFQKVIRWIDKKLHPKRMPGVAPHVYGAISQLDMINEDDPRHDESMECIRDWVNERLRKD
ncbi:MAG: hypothetical protein KJ822_06660 [Proteobacteria bacterium]|nr:hypothetical protein [Pseudomonadota bacterium]MBU4355013.1 hypothetical protein [Pseudomonadota bacterium]